MSRAQPASASLRIPRALHRLSRRRQWARCGQRGWRFPCASRSLMQPPGSPAAGGGKFQARHLTMLAPPMQALFALPYLVYHVFLRVEYLAKTSHLNSCPSSLLKCWQMYVQ